MYEDNNSLNLRERLLENEGFNRDDFYAQYHLIDCHESRITPIYRFVMNTGNMAQPEFQVELEYFRNMDPVRRFEILNRDHVHHRRIRSERMRLTLMHQANMLIRNSRRREIFEALRGALFAMWAKRYQDLTEEERQRVPIRSRHGAN